jgi:AcrR family transcriptional regulator
MSFSAQPSTPQPSTRDRLLDAFERLLIEGGERSATLDAVAAAAAVSKGGLLYHFGSKEALIEGQLTRLAEFAATDADNIRTAPAGPVDYLIRTSIDTGSPFDRAYVAATRLGQGAHPRAVERLADIRRGWLSVIEEAVGDPDVAQAVMLISDGLYSNSALMGPLSAAPEVDAVQSMDRLVAVIGRLHGRIPPVQPADSA